MSEWQPIETAPKDGTPFFTYWREWPVFVAWIEGWPEQTKPKRFPWSKPRVIPAEPGGFRVLSWSPRFAGWGICANCAVFTPRAWQPLPSPPEPKP